MISPRLVAGLIFIMAYCSGGLMDNRRFLRMQDENGACRAADDALGGAFSRRVLRTGAVPSGDYDQVHFQFSRHFGNFIECDAAAHQGFALAFRVELPPFEGMEMFLAPLYRARIGSPANHRTVPEVRGGSDRFDHVQQHQPRAELPGKRLGVAHRDLRWPGKISWQKDLADLDGGEWGLGLSSTMPSRQAVVCPWFSVVPRFHGRILFWFSLVISPQPQMGTTLRLPFTGCFLTERVF
jgi:hypothetical protein